MILMTNPDEHATDAPHEQAERIAVPQLDILGSPLNGPAERMAAAERDAPVPPHGGMEDNGDGGLTAPGGDG